MQARKVNPRHTEAGVTWMSETPDTDTMWFGVAEAMGYSEGDGEYAYKVVRWMIANTSSVLLCS